MRRADTTMREAADIEDSWEVLSSNSSCDSRTPVALHFPVDLIPRATSEALAPDVVSKPWDLPNPPRPTSLDDASLAWRRKTAAAAGKWQSANLSTAAAGASEAGTVSMDTSSMSHGSSDTGDDGCSHGTANAARQIAAAPEPIMTNRGSTALSNLGNTKRVGDVNPPNTPPQPFSGVLAGESWYTVPADMQATADQAEAKTVPLTIVFAGAIGSGKSASCNTVMGRHGVDPASGNLATADLTMQGGRPVTIVDTPGLGQQGAQEAVVESLRCAAASGAATVLALVISVGAPNVAKQVAAAAAVLQAVGPSGPSHAMVVLTHADAMNLDCALLPSYLATAPSALQGLVEEVGARAVLLDNSPGAANREGCTEALLDLASSAAADGASAAWLPPPAQAPSQEQQEAQGKACTSNEEAASARGPSDVSRLRKAVVYSIAACGMVGLRVLTSGGGTFSRGSSGGSICGVGGAPGPISPAALCGPLSWRLEDDDTGDDSRAEAAAADTSGLEADCEAFVQVAATTLL